MKANPIYVVAAAVGILVVAAAFAVNTEHRRADVDLAAPGAELYQRAVTESVSTLVSRGEAQAGRPPSPGPDYFWCENCRTYHRRQNVAARPAGANAAAVRGAPAPHVHPRAPGDQPADPAVPSPGPDYFWCENCKTYHRRQAPQNGQAGLSRQNPVLPAAGGGAVPRTAPPGYYYCDQCKTYHLGPAADSHGKPVSGAAQAP